MLIHTGTVKSLPRYAVLAAVALRLAARTATIPLPLHLTADGRICMGYFHLEQHSLVWKTHFATCRGEGWTGVERDGIWYLTVHQTETEAKVCPLGYITMEEIDPSIPKAGWEISSYRSEAEYHKDPQHAILSCWEQY